MLDQNKAAQARRSSRITASDIALIEYGQWMGRRLSGMFLGAVLTGATLPVAGALAVTKIQDSRNEIKPAEDKRVRDNILLIAFTTGSLLGTSLFLREKRKLDNMPDLPSSRLE